jgi:hypothetical protein
MNRVGDMSLTIGFFALLALIGNLDYSSIAATIPYLNENAVAIIAFLLLIGASAKSAQLFLFTWLPQSMEGKNKYMFILILPKFVSFILVLYFLLENSKFSNLIENNILPYWIDMNNEIILLSTLNLIPFNIKNPNLPKEILDPLIGNLLGDGHLRYSNRSAKDKTIVTGNVNYAMTLKSREYTYHLWDKIYRPICTKTMPNPWPNNDTPSQYHFKTRSLIALTLLHQEWYIKTPDTNKYKKIIPLKIENYLTNIGLAYWIMDDGYFDNTSKTIIICTDDFTYTEILLLIKVLQGNFNLLATPIKRTRPNKIICWRIRFSIKNDNIENLKKIIQPYFIPSMYYKLNIK